VTDEEGEWLTPEQVHAKFGDHWCKCFLTLVDEEAGMVRIVEECTVKGTVEWDSWNRRRAAGIVTDVRVEGTTLTMDARIGAQEPRFGPAASQLGAQALASVEIRGDEVHTRWMGLAGAGYALKVCLAQAPGVKRARFGGTGGTGGAHMADVEVVTPLMRRFLVGIDDTDTKEEGATWALGLRLGRSMPVGRFLEHRLVQLNPNVPEKTTNCVATCLSFAIRPDQVDEAKDFAFAFVEDQSFSDNSSVAFFEGLRVPEDVQAFGRRAKREFLGWEEAERVARASGVDLRTVTGQRGHIGSLAAIGCYDMGAEAAALPSDLD
jgi:methanogenesis imperfect marker protein 11